MTAEIWRNLLRILASPGAARRAAESHMIDLGYADGNEAFRAGEVDALVSLHRPPVPAYQELGRQVPVKFLDVDPAVAARFISAHPFYALGSIPAETYPGQGRAVATLTTPLVLVTSSERSGADERQLLQAIRKNSMFQASPVGNLPCLSAVPFHPGAG